MRLRICCSLLLETQTRICLREGVAPEKIRFVGNVMIDSLHRNLERARRSQILGSLNLEPGKYCAMTLHRPSNVDVKETLSGILDALEVISERLPIVFPIHPRTRARLNSSGSRNAYAGAARCF